MHVKVIRERCCGSGGCVLMAPEVFDHDLGDGRVLVIQEQLPDELIECARDAAEICPTQAITVE